MRFGLYQIPPRYRKKPPIHPNDPLIPHGGPAWWLVPVAAGLVALIVCFYHL